jgi:hypothetical protein
MKPAAVRAGQVEVAEHQVESAILFEQTKGVVRAEGDHVVIPERAREEAQQAGLVVDGQDSHERDRS